MGGERHSGGIFAAGLVGALALIIAASRRPRQIKPEAVNTAMTALYGPLGPLSWASVVWEPITGGMGISTAPTAAQAAALQRLVADVVTPITNLTPCVIEVPPGGGFVPTTMRGLRPNTCPYGGHEDGQALDLRSPNRPLGDLLHLVISLGRFDRVVLTPDHVHVQLADPPRNAHRVFVVVPNTNTLDPVS